MKAVCIVILLIVSTVAVGENRSTRIKIATVPDEYKPTDTSMTERVSLEDFRFEVNQETARARVVVEYTYPDQIVFSKDDDGGGPPPTIVQIPGLKYLPQTQEIVFDADGRQTVCAQVQQRKGFFGTHIHVKNTGLCTVTARRTKHAEDDGWQIQRFTAIDTYFEVH